MRAGYDYNPALQNFNAMFNFGAYRFNVKNVKN